MATTTLTRRCYRCSGTGPFANARKYRCTRCDKEAAESKKSYLRLYHRARSRAMTRLIHQHQEEYDAMLDRELKKVRREETQGRAVARRDGHAPRARAA